MACDECRHARNTSGLWNRFDSLKCIYCAARLIQVIGKRNAPRDQLSAERAKELKESVERGLDEQRIRELVKGPLALEPLEKADKQEKGKKT